MSPDIATNRRVDRDALVAFVATRHRVVLTTFRRDGMPQSSPVTAGSMPRGAS